LRAGPPATLPARESYTPPNDFSTVRTNGISEFDTL
jgi:hypothetical protein